MANIFENVGSFLGGPFERAGLKTQAAKQQVAANKQATSGIQQQQVSQSYQNLQQVPPEQQGQMKTMLDQYWASNGIPPEQLQLMQQGVLGGQGAFGGFNVPEGMGLARSTQKNPLTGETRTFEPPKSATDDPYGDINEVQDIQSKFRSGDLSEPAALAMMGDVAKRRKGDPSSDLYKLPSQEAKDPTKAQKTSPSYWSEIKDVGGESLYTPEQSNKMAKAYAKDPSGTKENLKQASVLRKEYQSHEIYSNHQTVMKSASQMEAALKRSRDGTEASRLASDQALGVLFQKMLDPTSVVRESEYARTAEGAAALSRLKAILPQLLKGGLAISDGDRQALFDMADDFLKISKEKMAEHNTRYSALAKGYEVDPSLVIESRTENPASKLQPSETPTLVGAKDAEAAYKALPSKTVFIDPNGKKRTKP